MKVTLSGLLLALLFAGTAAHAQMYKWVGSDGKVTYSDIPPPKSATRVEQKNLSEANAVGSDLPFDVAQAAQNHPVTLYTGEKCEPCVDGRNFLTKRGIPFREKTVTTGEDLARMKQATSESRLPVLMIGRSKQAGFEEGAWGTSLTAAGYPATSKLPKTYRNPLAEAAAPKPNIEQTAQNKRTENLTTAQPAENSPSATGNAPPGFRF